MNEQNVVDVANSYADNGNEGLVVFLVIAAAIVIAAIVLRDKAKPIKPKRLHNDKNFYTDPDKSAFPGNIFNPD